MQILATASCQVTTFPQPTQGIVGAVTLRFTLVALNVGGDPVELTPEQVFAWGHGGGGAPYVFYNFAYLPSQRLVPGAIQLDSQPPPVHVFCVDIPLDQVEPGQNVAVVGVRSKEKPRLVLALVTWPRPPVA